MDVLDGGHQQSGETHQDGGGVEGWRDGERSAERKKKKKAPHKSLWWSSSERWSGWARMEEKTRPRVISGARLLSAASAGARRSISPGVMARYSATVAAPAAHVDEEENTNWKHNRNDLTNSSTVPLFHLEVRLFFLYGGMTRSRRTPPQKAEQHLLYIYIKKKSINFPRHP